MNPEEESLELLRRLKQQVEIAIAAVENGCTYEMTEAQRLACFREGRTDYTIILGDFGIDALKDKATP